MKSLLLLLAITANAVVAQETCPVTQEKISVSGAAIFNAQYMRVDPTGTKVIVTNATSRVYIVDFADRNNVKVIPTSMAAEAYPVEGEREWRFIASPFDRKPNQFGQTTEAMRYYDFRKLTAGDDARQVAPEFSDREHDEFYHSSAVIDGAGTDTIKVRTMLWSANRTRDYQFKLKADGTLANAEVLRSKEICTNITHPVLNAEQQVVRDRLRVERDHLLRGLSREPPGSSRRSELRSEYHTVFKQLRPLEVWHFSQPILSKDGKYVAALWGERDTTQIYKIRDDGDCDLIADTGMRTSKVSFSYPEEGRLPKLVYINEGGPSNGYRRTVGLYDLNSKKEQVIDVGNSTPYYVGMALDGRIIHLDQREWKIVVNTLNCAANAQQQTAGTK